MSEEKQQTNAFDPFESLRGIRDAYLDSVSRTMIEAVNSEAYAEATGAMLEGYLTASAPFREALEKSMIQSLQHLSLPSRQEVAALAQRFTSVEKRLDDLDAKLDLISTSIADISASAQQESVGSAAVQQKPGPNARPRNTDSRKKKR